MGKKKTSSDQSPQATPGVNKTQAIKAALAAHPDKGPKAISALLNEQGVNASAAYVSTIKTTLKNKQGGKTSAATRKSAHGESAYAPLLAAKKLVDQIGSVEEAKKAIDALGKLLA